MVSAKTLNEERPNLCFILLRIYRNPVTSQDVSLLARLKTSLVLTNHAHVCFTAYETAFPHICLILFHLQQRMWLDEIL